MLSIPNAEYQGLRRHGEAAYPHESCGVLLGQTRGEERIVTAAVPCRNERHDSPQDRYTIPPRELLRLEGEARERGEQIVGFYHSHPDHPARWSPTDLAEAHWVGCSYVITRVAGGRAEETRSFVLRGEAEEDKSFADEDVRIVAAAIDEPAAEAAAP